MQCTDLVSCLAGLFAHAEFLSNVEAVATVVALIVGGWWTYTRFIRGRHHYPRAELTHEVLDRALGSGKRFVQVRLGIKNIGGTLMQVSLVDARVQQVSPLADDELDDQTAAAPPLDEAAPANMPWPLVARRLKTYDAGAFEIEPGEADWIEFDFALDDPLEVVRVYTYVANVAKGRRPGRAIGWRQASYYEIGTSSKTAPTSTVRAEEEQSGPEDVPPRAKPARPAPRQPRPARAPGGPKPQGEPESVPDRRPSPNP